MAHDVIVVGARMAGSATALLLARAGIRVLVVDQARFPSDTLSTHQLQPPGVARLAKWGLLDSLLATGVPPTRRVRFHADAVVIDGHYPNIDGVDALLSPRRTVLDSLLLDAARRAGAEVREATAVTELLRAEDGRVVGVRCRAKPDGGIFDEHAALVVGADGRHSSVARLVDAPEYHTAPPRSLACYSYWDGLELDCGELYSGAGFVAGAWQTNDGLVITYAGRSIEIAEEFRHAPDAMLVGTLDMAGTLGERARAAKRVGPTRGTTDLRNTFRRPYGPGWVLVGDAGLVMDPITGLGMGHALRDAELAAAAISAGLDQPGRLQAELQRYARRRDRETKPSYDLTLNIAKVRPLGDAERAMFAAIAADPQASTRFLATISGSRPVKEFFSPGNLIKLVGIRGFLALARSRP